MGRLALGIAAALGLALSTTSCVPLLIAAAGVTVGYIARDEGVGQAPPLEGGGYRDSRTESYREPEPYGDGSGGSSGGDYDLPVY